MPLLGPDTPARVCERFSTTTQSTIPFVSCDNMTFHIERAKLERAADFAPPSTVHSSPTEPVHLDDTSLTLELLFRFVYCEVYIDLDAESFRVVADLAEAAEKYMVYSAMTVCRLYMKNKHDKHPWDVMKYAARYDYKDILDVSAPYTVGSDFENMKVLLPPSYLLPWFVFNSRYQQVAQSVVDRCYHINSSEFHVDEDGDWEPCPLRDDEDEDAPWVAKYQREIALVLLRGGLGGVVRLDRVFTKWMAQDLKCHGCVGFFEAWKKSVADTVKEVPAFRTFL